MKTKAVVVMVALVGQVQAQQVPTIQVTRVDKIDPDGVPVVEVTEVVKGPITPGVKTAPTETLAVINYHGNDTIIDCPNDKVPPAGCDSIAPPDGTAPCGWWRYRKDRFGESTCPPTDPRKYSYHVLDRCDHTRYHEVALWGPPIIWTGNCGRKGYFATITMTAEYPDCKGYGPTAPDVGCEVCPPDQNIVSCVFSGVVGCDNDAISLGAVALSPYGVGNSEWTGIVTNGYDNLYDISITAYCDNNQFWITAETFGKDIFRYQLIPPHIQPVTMPNNADCSIPQNFDLGRGGTVTITW